MSAFLSPVFFCDHCCVVTMTLIVVPIGLMQGTTVFLPILFPKVKIHLVQPSTTCKNLLHSMRQIELFLVTWFYCF